METGDNEVREASTRFTVHGSRLRCEGIALRSINRSNDRIVQDRAITRENHVYKTNREPDASFMDLKRNKLKQAETSWNKLEQLRTSWNSLKAAASSWNKQEQAGKSWRRLKQAGANWNSLFQLVLSCCCLFHVVPACSKLFQLVPVSLKLFQLIPAFSKLFQLVSSSPRCCSLFQLVPTCSSLFRVFWPLSACLLWLLESVLQHLFHCGPRDRPIGTLREVNARELVVLSGSFTSHSKSVRRLSH